MELLNNRYDPAVPVNKLKPHELNPREGDLGAISQSIAHNGFYGALIVQESTGKILAGNHRWRSAIGEGAETIPVIYVQCDDETAKRILVADNRANDLSSYNFQALAEVLDSIRSDQGDFTGVLYDNEDFDRIISDLSNGYVAGDSTTSKSERSDAVEPQVFEAPNATDTSQTQRTPSDSPESTPAPKECPACGHRF